MAQARNIQLAGALAVIGGTLLVLVAFNLPARLQMISVDDTRRQILEGATVSGTELSDFVTSRQRILGWRESAEVYGDIAMGQALIGKNETDRDAAKPIFAQALDAQTNALSRSFLDTYGWLQLVYLLFQTKGASEQAAQALSMSILTAPYEPRLAVSRVAGLIRLWDHLDDNTKEMAPTLIRQAWKIDPNGVAQAAISEHGLAIVSDALKGGSDLKEFNALVDAKKP